MTFSSHITAGGGKHVQVNKSTGKERSVRRRVPDKDPPRWEVEVDGGKWAEYEPAVALSIESSFAGGASSMAQVTVGKWSYEIRFDRAGGRHVQVNKSTGKERRVVRRSAHSGEER